MQKKTERQKSSSEPDSSIRAIDSWFGENEHIPLKYLMPSGNPSIEETLKNIPFCTHLTENRLQEITKDGTIRNLDAGKVILSEGDKADSVYVILEGKVKVYKEDEEGNEIEIATIEKGNMFGEMALFDQGIRSASVKTIEHCRFLIFEGDKFLELLLE